MHGEQKRNYRIKCIGVFVALVILVIIAFLIFHIVEGEVSSVDYVSLLISAFAFFFSAFNFLRMEKPAKIKVFPGENAIIAVGRNEIGFHIPLTFLNDRYNTGVVKKCVMEIKSKGQNSIHNIEWESFCKDEGYNWDRESEVYPIAISGKSNLKKVVTFLPISDGDNIFFSENNSYEIAFKIWLYGENKEHYITSPYTLYITNKIYNDILREKRNRTNLGLSHIHIKLTHEE